MRAMLVTLLVSTAALVIVGNSLRPVAAPIKPPYVRIDEGFADAQKRPLLPYNVLVEPNPVPTYTCTKKWCEPHRKGLDHLVPFDPRN